VQHRIGASRFTVASPVLRPTFFGPNSRHSASHFSFTSAFTGHVYTERLPCATDWKCSAVATSDFPDPVGVFRITLRPSNSSRIAFSCAG
jgi:hypothetical protein